MRTLPVAARVYILAMALAGAGAFAWSMTGVARSSADQLALAGALALLYGLAESRRFVIPRHSGHVVDFSLGTPVAIWAVLGLGPALTVPVVVLGYLFSAVGFRRATAWYKHVFNASQLALSYGATALCYWWLAEPGVPVLGSLRNTLAFLPVFGTYYLLNSGFVTLVVALVRREPFLTVWRQHYRETTVIDLAMVPTGAMLVLLWDVSPVALLLAGLPLYVVFKCFRSINELHTQTRASLVALSRTLDRRDPATYHHSETVAAYARAIAERLGLAASQIDLIVEAARLHDIGKVGVRDSILLKSGPLTVEERREMERHPEIGAEIIESFSVFEDGVALVRHHHERYDGEGYPSGLAGEGIPLGARIIFVADAFEAMTADRPYRAGMPRHVAAQRLLEGAGTQFDPDVVAAMLEVLGIEPAVLRPAPLVEAEVAVPAATAS